MATTDHVPACEPSTPDATGTPQRPFVLGGRAVGRPTLQPALAWVTVLSAFFLPVPGLYRGVGSSMEEAFMLVFPREIAAGRFPNRDFLHLYGPGALHVLTGWFAVFGDSLTSERTVGLVQLLAAVVALFVLTRPWGLRAAVPAALTTIVLLITPTGLAALAWPGALAMSLWSVVFGVRAGHTESRQARRCLLIGGVLAGLAAAYRPDLVVALGLAWGVILFRGRRDEWLRFGGGAVIGLLPVWVHFAMVGIGPVWRGTIVEPLFDLRPGRRLPVPPSWGELDGALQALGENPVDAPWWGLPAIGPSQQIFVWFVVTVATAVGWVVFAAMRARRLGRTPDTVLFASVAAFGLGIVGQAIQRPDSTHLAWGSCIGLALVPVVVVISLSDRTSVATDAERGFRGVELVPTVAIAAVLLIVAPFFTLRTYLFTARVSIGDRPGGFEVSHDGKRFLVPNAAVQDATQQAVDFVGEQSRPGESLLVGPADLSRTVYSDVMFYYLLPDLEPATYFIEMDPGIADAPDSGLADEVAAADWLILTNFWTGWYEPNASIEFGDATPNAVVASDFCNVGNYADGLVLVFQRCADGDGVDPATIGIGPDRRAAMESEARRRNP